MNRCSVCTDFRTKFFFAKKSNLLKIHTIGRYKALSLSALGHIPPQASLFLSF